jgi:hypothetical protein
MYVQGLDQVSGCRVVSISLNPGSYRRAQEDLVDGWFTVTSSRAVATFGARFGRIPWMSTPWEFWIPSDGWFPGK